jgi:hypothetical protein
VALRDALRYEPPILVPWTANGIGRKPWVEMAIAIRGAMPAATNASPTGVKMFVPKWALTCGTLGRCRPGRA